MNGKLNTTSIYNLFCIIRRVHKMPHLSFCRKNIWAFPGVLFPLIQQFKGKPGKWKRQRLAIFGIGDRESIALEIDVCPFEFCRF